LFNCFFLSKEFFAAFYFIKYNIFEYRIEIEDLRLSSHFAPFVKSISEFSVPLVGLLTTFLLAIFTKLDFYQDFSSHIPDGKNSTEKVRNRRQGSILNCDL